MPTVAPSSSLRTRPARVGAGPALWLLRAMIVAWLCACVWMANSARDAIRALDYGPREVRKVSTSLDRGAGRLHELGDTPVVGGAIDAVAGTITDASSSTRRVATWSTQRIDELARNVWWLVFVLPSIPALLTLVLAEWMSRRLRRMDRLRNDVSDLQREVAELRATLGDVRMLSRGS